jgi:LmbE family N-acetylglucosaminyl deacetylase
MMVMNGRHTNGDGPAPPRILVIGAHPDDETLGAGGTIARYAAAGSEVWVCIVCDGVTRRHGETGLQRRCAEEACEVLGASKVVFCDLPDQRLDGLSLVDVITPIEACVDEFRPDIVLTHFKEDVNQDHRIVFDATMVATRPSPDQPVRTLMCYETASSTEWAAPFQGGVFAPNVFVDITATLDRKVEAMSRYANTHVSEVKAYPHPRSLEAVELYAKRQGVVVGTHAAEPFMLVRGIL